jgi:hypothetical protein
VQVPEAQAEAAEQVISLSKALQALLTTVVVVVA